MKTTHKPTRALLADTSFNRRQDFVNIVTLITGILVNHKETTEKIIDNSYNAV